MYVTHRVLEILLQAGARQAEPGEFTKRAFLNGKMDLSQAEAVADLIAARSRRAHLSSVEQLEGRLASHVKGIRSSLVDLCSMLEIDLDFSEEGIDLIAGTEIRGKLEEVFDFLGEMAASFDVGRFFREGVPVAIVGRPNAGKSSLFNTLLQSDRAIVTPVPGTTRDSLEESITISGVLFRLADTAGLRRSGDIVEAEGVERSKAVVRRVDLVILVADSTKQHDRRSILADLEELQAGQRVVVAHNKIDLLDEPAREPERFQTEGISGVEVWISAKTGEGIEQMKGELVNLSFGGATAGEGGLYLTNRRHRDAIARAKRGVERAISALDGGASNEFIAFDVREGIESLSEITGEVTSEEILNSIFGRFCVGK
jgi:tRNA modification GTPase